MKTPGIETQDNTIIEYLDRWVDEVPDHVWLRDRKGDEFTEWTWQEARTEAKAMASWLASSFGTNGSRFVILSRNRAHWILADMATTLSGNVSVPIFTTQTADSAKYILEFTEAQVVFVGESENWDEVNAVIPDNATLVAFPGVSIPQPHKRWEEVVSEYESAQPDVNIRHDDLISLVFTSGTTGVPKGVMQTHDSMLVPMERAARAFCMRKHPRFLSYLPLAHIAERQLVTMQSLIHCGTVTFNEGLPHLVRDMGEAKPTYFFGAPRVWEQMQQGILAQFGSQDAMDAALAADGAGVQAKIKGMLGLEDTDYLLTAAAPTPAALIHWYEKLGIVLMEGYGQTEAMGLIGNKDGERRVGSIGKPIDGVEVRIAESDELLCRATGLSPGYYNMPDKTAETFVDGWVHTGDKAKVDDDGYYYITGRVKDYFKTIQGKFVAPVPIENAFAKNQWVEQQCLLGRGYSKTVMTCVLAETAQTEDRGMIEEAMKTQVQELNEEVDKHARVGAVIITREPWTIENGVLTPTLKIKRDEVEARFGNRAEELARDAAVNKTVLVEWM